MIFRESELSNIASVSSFLCIKYLSYFSSIYLLGLVVMRTKAPRADRLDKIRDIAVIVHKNDDYITKNDLTRRIKSIVSPPQLNSWTMSNIREYISALVFLKLAISPKREMIYLTNLGKLLASENNFGSHKLNEMEKEILRNAIFQNDRFQKFLALFSNGKVPKNRTEFVTIGGKIKLKHNELKTELDRREVEDIFKSWALSTEIIEWNSTTNRFYPVMRRDIPSKQIFEFIMKIYNEVEDKSIGRAEIYKIKDIVCEKFRIPCRQFYDDLITISKRYPDKIRLEVAPMTMMPIQKYKIDAAEHFGIITSKGVYYYMKIHNFGDA